LPNRSPSAINLDFQEMSRHARGANARRYNPHLEEFTPLIVDFLDYA
jgi:hypothetical protein